MTYSMLDIQKKLKGTGFDPGPLDGIFGRATMKAVKMFQIQHPGLKVDGIPGPKTVKILFGKKPGDVVDVGKLVEMPWLDIAISKKGLRENVNNTELRKFLKSDGSTLGDPAELPWCGDFVETCIALSLTNEILPANPYLARNWQRFGIVVQATFGAVGVFWRGQKTGLQGHVGFLVGESTSEFYVLGGNQNNMVSVAPIAKGRLLSANWPTTATYPTEFKLPQAKGGVISINEE